MDPGDESAARLLEEMQGGSTAGFLPAMRLCRAVSRMERICIVLWRPADAADGRVFPWLPARTLPVFLTEERAGRTAQALEQENPGFQWTAGGMPAEDLTALVRRAACSGFLDRVAFAGPGDTRAVLPAADFLLACGGSPCSREEELPPLSPCGGGGAALPDRGTLDRFEQRFRMPLSLMPDWQEALLPEQGGPLVQMVKRSTGPEDSMRPATFLPGLGRPRGESRGGEPPGGTLTPPPGGWLHVSQVRRTLDEAASRQRNLLDPGGYYRNFSTLISTLVVANGIKEQELDRYLDLPRGYTRFVCTTPNELSRPAVVLELYLRFFGLREYLFQYRHCSRQLDMFLSADPELGRYEVKGARGNREWFTLLRAERVTQAQGFLVCRLELESEVRKVTVLSSTWQGFVPGHRYTLRERSPGA